MGRNYFAAFFGLALLMPGLLPSPEMAIAEDSGAVPPQGIADMNAGQSRGPPTGKILSPSPEEIEALKASALLAGIGLTTGLVGFIVAGRLD